jgi:hypothetical protein
MDQRTDPLGRAIGPGVVRLLLAFGMLGLTSPVQAADGAVGTGTPQSCTEAAFDDVLFAVEGSGGGTITFACGPAATPILFTTIKPISADTLIQGGDLVTLSGGNSTSLFQVYYGHTLTLSHITLTHGYGTYGAVQSFGTLILESSQLSDNIATDSGGAIDGYGDVSLTDSIVQGNSAAQMGGGIMDESGTLTVTNSQVDDNTAAQGGGIAVISGASATIQGSQLTGNQTTATSAQGGAVRSEGTLAIDQSELTLNHGSRGGGLSVLGGTATVTHSTFRGNYSAYGGGIRQEGGDLTVTDVQFTHNGYASNGAPVNTGGGAISWGAGTATLTDVGMNDNWASYGGGLDQDGVATTLTNVTLSGNAAVGGGAIDLGAGTLELVNVTIVGNDAAFFGGLGNRGGTLTLKNTLLSGNLNSQNGTPFNCDQPVSTSSFSMSSDYTCGFGVGYDVLDLRVAPLAANGGDTLTHLLGIGSPAIDGGTGIGCPPTDARGVTRPQGLACDVGAVEMTPEPGPALLGLTSLVTLALLRGHARPRSSRGPIA